LEGLSFDLFFAAKENPGVSTPFAAIAEEETKRERKMKCETR
jgi:hypothetical protein